MLTFTSREKKIFRSLDTPSKIQNFLNRIPYNFEPYRETCLSPRLVLKQKRAHCIEGAMLAATILRFHGHRPLLVDLTTNDRDKDHVIAVFQRFGHWGAISKTNYAVLRYREPIYRSIRELVMSYFHEYFLDNGEKTLRSYSLPINLAKFDKENWMSTESDVWYIYDHLFDVKHYPILSRSQLAALRLAEPIERKIGKIKEWDRLKVVPQQKLCLKI